MGRINNANWVNQHRKIQGKFQNKQDIEAYLFDKNLSNGSNIQENNRLNIDDLPNIPALLADEPNLSGQSIIEPIDGGKAHTPATQVFLSTLTALSANTTALSKQAISTDSQNSLSSTVKSFTEMSKSSPVLFDTTSAIMSTSQNHDESKESTTHNDNQSLIRVKRAGMSEYDIYGEVLYIQDVFLDTEMIKQKLKDNSNVNKLTLINVQGIDAQKVQEMGTILKNSNISTLFFERMDTTIVKELMAILKYTNISTICILPDDTHPEYMDVDYKYIKEVITNLKETKVEQLIFNHLHMGDKQVIDIIKLLKEVSYNVKTLYFVDNDISNKGAEDIASKLRDTQITQVNLVGNRDITPETLQRISMILEDNRHVNEDSYTSTMESSSTKEGSSKDISGKQEKKEDLTTPKGNIIETLEPIAEDSTTPTPQESNPNNPTSSTISMNQAVSLTALAVSIISAIGGTVVYGIKKFCDGKKSYIHYDLPLVEPISDSHLDNNKDIPLTGVLVNNEADI
ncbi:MAG: hypothetical protein ACE1S7_06135 [Candidatus Tisiphia sp.]